MFANTRGSAPADQKGRNRVRINFAELLPDETNYRNFEVCPINQASTKVFIKNEFKARGSSKFIPSLNKKCEFEPTKKLKKEIQGCTLKNYFECKLISPEEIEEEEPSIGKKKKYKLSVRENLRKFRSNISSPPRAFTKQTSRKECQPCSSMKCMIHNNTRRSVPTAPTFGSRNSMSCQNSVRNSINIITSHHGIHKQPRICKKKMRNLKQANSIVKKFMTERNMSQPKIPVKSKQEQEIEHVIEEAKKGSLSPARKMMSSHLKTAKRFSILRDKFKPKENNFLSLIKNLKKDMEQEEIDEDDHKLFQNGHDRLLDDVKGSLNILDNNNKLLKKLQNEAKISWKRSVLSAMESFKDFKLSSVDEFKKSVPQKPMFHPSAPEFFSQIKHNNFYDVRFMLQTNPKLVYEFDARFQTGLHWAAKRGYCKILRLLLQYGANINLKDVSGRTPLYIACKYNQTDVVRILLANKANTFSKCSRKISPQEATSDHAIHQMLEKGKMIHVVMRFIPENKRKNVLNELGLNYFLKDIEKELEDQTA
ncbi:unnamed protein product [Moneuplotes crassus]|uniref:Uncharacterized protein n=2 Tax=Euplotes crassus TaxID=5936 RepID=A0AAD1Y6A8_EUPCR|nr:unnamed protein product [Moneuplotes crassus]